MPRNRRGREVDQIVGAIAPTPVVEELDAHVSIDSEHPVTGVMNLVNECPLGRRQLQPNNWPSRGIRHRSRHRGRPRRNQRRKLAKQHRRILPSLNSCGCPVARLASPPCAAVVIVKSGCELLNQTVKGNRRFAAKRPAGGHLLGRKDIEQDAEMRTKPGRVGPKVRRGAYGYGELRKDVTSGGDRECLARRRTTACEQRVDGLAYSGSVRIRHEQPYVVSQILKRLLSLQRGQGVGEHTGPSGIERIESQGPDVGMLNQVALDARCQYTARYCRTTDGWLRHAEGSAYVAKQPTRVVLGRRSVKRPERMDVVDRGEHAPVAHRQHRREIDRRQSMEQCVPRRCDVLAGGFCRLRHPSRAELRPGELPERAQRMRWCDQCRFADLSAVVLDDETHGVYRQRRPQ